MCPRKNPPANRRVVFGKGFWRAWLRERFGNLRCELNGSRVISFYAMKLMAALEHAVELVDQHRNGFVTLVGLDGGVQIGPMDLDVALGLELDAARERAIALQFHADAHDALLVAKQSIGFLADERLQRRGQVEVDARYDQFVVILAVHVSACCFG